MATHAERVLSAIIYKQNTRRDLLALAVLRLGKEHFTTEAHRALFLSLVRYYDLTGGVMPQDLYQQTLTDSGVDPAKVLAFTKVYEQLSAQAVNQDDFKWSLQELVSEQAKRQTGVVITEAMEILERGYEDRKGQYYKGHEDARKYLASKIHEIERAETRQDAPEGNVFTAADDIWADYLERKNGDKGKGVLSGIAAIDDRTGGFYRGELIMVVAYANMGKSMISTQAAWHCAVEQKKNVFFATSETLRDQVMRRILARHSRLPQFDHPINSADIKRGTLNAADEKVLQDVLEDWRYNSEYGKLNVVQIPAHSTLSYVENRLREYGREVDLSLCIMDYLALLEPEVRRGNEREEFNQIIRSSKGIAQGYNDGLGIPFISPWQISREAYDHAMRTGHYTRKSLADTSEAEKSSDQIIAIIREENNNREMNLQFLKMRDEEIPPIVPVAIDLRHAYIGAHHGPQTLAAGVTNGVDDLLAMAG